jgi:hypothetical protein
MSVRKEDGVDGVEHLQTTTARFLNESGSDISAGDAVMIDISEYTTNGRLTIEATNVTNQNEGLAFGIAKEDIDDGQVGFVVIGGWIDDANVAATVAIGDRLVASATAGRLQEVTQVDTSQEDDYTVVAVALEAASSNTAAVLVCNQGWFV